VGREKASKTFREGTTSLGRKGNVTRRERKKVFGKGRRDRRLPSHGGKNA